MQEGLSVSPSASASNEAFLDARGLPNPEPILMLAGSAESLGEGQSVRMISDDKCFPADFVRWAGGTDLQVVSLRYPTGDLTEVVMRRRGRPQH